MIDTQEYDYQALCVYNEDSNTLRIEYDYAECGDGDRVIGENDILTIKVFISYICTYYGDYGNNATSLRLIEVQTIYNDINLFMLTFDEIQNKHTIDVLMEETQWTVK